MRVALAVAVACLGAGPAAAQAPDASAPAPAATPAPTAAPAIPFDVRIDTRWRLRWTDDDADQDLSQVLSGSVGAAGRTEVSAHVLVRWSADLDGEREETGFAPFDALADTRARPMTALVLAAHLDVHAIPQVERLRVGRQTLAETPVTLLLDGLRLTSRPAGPLGIAGEWFGGRPAHLWASAPSGDTLYGAACETRPARWLRGRVDWVHADGGGTFDATREDLFAISAWGEIPGVAHLHARHTRIAGIARDVQGRAGGTIAPLALAWSAAYTELLEPQSDLALDLDPFTAVLVPLAPYRQAQASLACTPLAPFTVEGSVDARWLVHDHDVGPFNREFVRWRGAATLRDWPVAGGHATASGDAWDAEGRHVFAGGGEVGVERGGVRVTAGTDYARYRYDAVLRRETTDVRTWFAVVRARVSAAFEGRVRYAYEDGDDGISHRVEAGVTWRFA